jgi:16S rRNA (adenine1518-N6/adenine1519-N6)-dimethyltransferase
MKPKKSLGQNFLINPKVAERIATEAGISKKDTVLEIGPGTGNLTKYLLERAKKVVAVEKDDRLFENLQEKFSKEIKGGLLILIHEDILKFDPLLISPLAGGEKYKIIANIPYNITGAILKKFLTANLPAGGQPESMTLMVQKEVAERILAKDGKESLLSISVKAYGTAEILFKVGRGNFYPAPNVDSAVINIKNISRNFFINNKVNEGLFWEIVKTGFAHKRKKLSSNLKTLKNGSLVSVLSLGNKRAEDLTLSDWIMFVNNQ